MSAPAWLAGSFAALMIVVAVCCAGRLAVSRVPGRNTELDTDALHVLMGVAMAGIGIFCAGGPKRACSAA